MKFRKKPVVVEAVQWTGENHGELGAFAMHRVTFIENNAEIETLEGTMVANAGDWIIKGGAGEFYPCKPAIFEATYEPA